MYVTDRVFNKQTTNKGLYDDMVKPIIQEYLQGKNGAVIAYGQSGSGKTHTMVCICIYFNNMNYKNEKYNKIIKIITTK